MSSWPRVRVSLIVASLLVPVAACTTLIGTEDRFYVPEDASPPSDASAGADAMSRADAAGGAPPVADASPPPDGQGSPFDAALDAGPDANIVPNAGFENDLGAGGCGYPWYPYGNVTITSSTDARTGLASCLVCNPTTDLMSRLSVDISTPDAGRSIAASAWIAAVPAGENDAGVGMATVTVSVCYGGCDPIVSATLTPMPLPDWKQEQVRPVVIDQDASTTTTVGVFVSGGCVLVDDVVALVE